MYFDAPATAAADRHAAAQSSPRGDFARGRGGRRRAFYTGAIGRRTSSARWRDWPYPRHDHAGGPRRLYAASARAGLRRRVRAPDLQRRAAGVRRHRVAATTRHARSTGHRHDRARERRRRRISSSRPRACRRPTAAPISAIPIRSTFPSPGCSIPTYLAARAALVSPDHALARRGRRRSAAPARRGAAVRSGRDAGHHASRRSSTTRATQSRSPRRSIRISAPTSWPAAWCSTTR